MEKQRTVVAFDFDGTLTTKDTLLEFIAFAFGRASLCMGLILHSPLLIMMKLRLYPNGKAKQKVFSWFFKGMEYKKFAKLGEDFADIIDTMKKETMIATLRKHQKEGCNIYVISASIHEWVHPFCRRLGLKNILATQVEINDKGLLTGRFATPNCYGSEKVHRLLEVEPMRSEYYLYAYGDSEGDRELISFANKGFYV